MAKFPFDAATGRSDWSTVFDTALACAEYLWLLPVADLPLDDLIELASTDRAAYDGLLKWARTRPALSDEYKLRIYDALMRKPPRKGKADTARRNAKLRYIGEILCRDFGLKPTRNELSHSKSAADVLQELVPHLTVKAIQDVLTRRP